MNVKSATEAGRLHNRFLKLLIEKQDSITSLKEAVDLLCENAFPELGKEPEGIRQEIVNHVAERQKQTVEPEGLPKDLSRVLDQFEKTASKARSPKDLDGPARAALDQAHQLSDKEKLAGIIYISIFTESAGFWFQQLQEGPQYTSFSYHVWTDWLAMGQYDAQVALDFYTLPATVMARIFIDQFSGKIIAIEAGIVGALYSWLAYQRNVFQRTSPIPSVPSPTPHPKS